MSYQVSGPNGGIRRGGGRDNRSRGKARDDGNRSRSDVRDGNGEESLNPKVQLSKALSYVLRHNAKGLNLQSDGYVKLDEVMRLPKFKGKTIEEIRTVVEENDKQRFSLMEKDSILWIRANQGHSIKSVKELELEKITNPMQLPQVIHGTYFSKWESIKSQGLSKMGRNHIHFAIGKWGDKDVKSGMRENCDIFIYVNVHKAMTDEIEFYRSSNGVILSEGVKGRLDKKYFLKVVDEHDEVLYPEKGSDNKSVGNEGNSNKSISESKNNVDKSSESENNVKKVSGGNVADKNNVNESVNNKNMNATTGNQNNTWNGKLSFAEMAKRGIKK